MELLLLLSRISLDDSARNAAEALIANVNWDLCTVLSVKHGTAAIIYKNLYELKGVPPHILKKYQDIYNNLLRNNILQAAELDRLIDGLKKTGIEVISLKGAIAAEKIFGDIGVYPSADIDILVKLEDIDKIREFLETDGYMLNDVGFDEYREFFIKELYHINLSNGRNTIEPHWNLFMRYFITPPQFWWEESFVISSGHRQYRFLSPEKNILYTSFRLFFKGFIYLRFLVMVAEIVRCYRDNIDWNKLFGFAKYYKFENTLRVVLRLVNHLLGAQVPEEFTVIKRLRTKILYALILIILPRGEDPHPLYKALLIFLRDDSLGAFRVLLRRLFPSMGEIVSKYNLTSGSAKALIYYMLNPAMVLMRQTNRIKQ